MRGQGRLERMLGGAALELLARRIAQLGVARRAQPGWAPAPGEPQHLARRRPARQSDQRRPRESSSPCGAIVRQRQRPRAPSAAPRARSTARRRSASRRRRASAVLGPAVARRRGIEHDAAGDRGLGRGRADDHAVAARGGDGLAQPQLREARRARPPAPRSRAARRARRRTAVPISTCTSMPCAHARARRPAPAARRRAGSSRERRRAWPASRRAGSRCARRRRGRPRRAGLPPRARPAGRAPATERTRTSPPPGSSGEPVARGDRTRPQRARDDRADAVQREGAVDRQARRARGAAGRDRVGGRASSAARSSSRPAPRARGGLDDRRAGERRALEQLLDVGARQLGALVVDEVALA